jgi:glycosyltransferase involved in cell wall biosynthesis
MEKIKILVLSDHPLSPSGVGSQTKYMIEEMLKTGKYKFICFGGAIKHNDYEPIRFGEYGDDWVIYPVDGYGTQDMVRSILRTERPDMLWFMTDPRFWGWLWEIEDEIRANIPMVYYHVWDNDPPPTFNRVMYDSTDVVVSISKVTNKILKQVVKEAEIMHIPHAVNTDVFKKLPHKEIQEFKEHHFPDSATNEKMTFFWNNRNARRKQSGTLIFWFKEFLDIVGHDNARLLMHTEVHDPNGQDLEAIIGHLGLVNGEVIFSQTKVPPEGLSLIYNIADCTINISDAEGFGLATLESLACEKPIIVNMTGGLQEQVTDGEEWFGVGVEPSSRAVIGSQDIPWIHEDRISKNDFIEALLKIYNMPKEERDEIGRKGRNHAIKNYSLKTYAENWDRALTSIHERHGSWGNRKNYNRWSFKEVA